MAGIKFPGIGSGFDVASLSKAYLDQLTLPNLLRRNRVSSLGRENDSLGQLRSMLMEISNTLDSSRSVNGGIEGSKRATSSNTSIVTAAADSSATTGTYNVNVLSLAKTATASFSRSLTSGNDFVISDASQQGEVEITVGEGNDAQVVSVAVNELTTANDFVEQFNSQANGAARASLINIGTESESDFRIVISSTNVGEEKGTLAIESDNPDLLGEGGLGGTTIDQASNATLTISGIAGTIERSSNSVTDVISGVSLQLSSIGASTVSVSDDVGGAASKLESFISQFNDLVRFQKREDSVTRIEEDGEVENIYGSLARTNVDDDAVSSLRGAVSSARSESGSLSLASLGVRTERDGTLSFDRATFEAAFSNNPQAVTEVVTNLADRVSGVQGIVQQYTGYELQIDQAVRANDTEVSDLNTAISRLDRSAQAKVESLEQQFSRLDGLFAQLNAKSSFLTGLLRFNQ